MAHSFLLLCASHHFLKVDISDSILWQIRVLDPHLSPLKTVVGYFFVFLINWLESSVLPSLLYSMQSLMSLLRFLKICSFYFLSLASYRLLLCLCSWADDGTEIMLKYLKSVSLLLIGLWAGRGVHLRFKPFLNLSWFLPSPGPLCPFCSSSWPQSQWRVCADLNTL